MSWEIDHVGFHAISGFIDLILAKLTDDSTSLADNEYAGLKEFHCGDHG
jgi:hypothetical protein